MAGRFRSWLTASRRDERPHRSRTALTTASISWLAHRGEERQADQPRPDGGCDRQIGRTPAKRLLIVRVEMQRTPVHRTRHSRLAQLADEAVAIDRQCLETQPDRKQMPRVDAVHVRRWQLELLHVAQSLKVFLRDRFAGPTHVLGAGELMDPDRGGDVRHVVLVARREDAIVPTSIARVPVPRHRARVRAATAAACARPVRRRR